MNDIVQVNSGAPERGASRRLRDCWQLVYCAAGSGTLRLDDRCLRCRSGEVLAIPPRSNGVAAFDPAFQGVCIYMTDATLPWRESAVVTDDESRCLGAAFDAARHHFYSERGDRSAFLTLYGHLICRYLNAYHITCQQKPSVVEAIEQDILNHYGDCDYRLDDYLRSLPFNYDYLRKLYQKEMGLTPNRYLNELRLQSALESLTVTGGTSIADIGRMCGFREPLYFSRMFKKRFGVSPTAYLERMQSDANGSVPMEGPPRDGD